MDLYIDPNTTNLASIPDASINNNKERNGYKNIFLTGDCNNNLLNYNLDSNVAKFLDNLIAEGYLPLTTHPTRLASRTATLLDFISAKNINMDFSTGILTSSIADHFPLFINFKCSYTSSKNKNYVFRDFSEDKIEEFKARLSVLDWGDVLNIKYCQESFTAINNKINKHHEEIFPLKQGRINKACTPIQPWMTPGLINSRKSKEKLFAKKCRKPNFTNNDKFSDFNSIYKKLCRAAKNLYFKNKFEACQENI